jgi:hypothetical protein
LQQAYATHTTRLIPRVDTLLELAGGKAVREVAELLRIGQQTVRDRLNAFHGIDTVGRYGGHSEPAPGQYPARSWYVRFDVSPRRDGRFALEFLAWLINNDYRQFDTSGHRLLEWGGNGTASGEFIGPDLGRPDPIAVDGSGNVYATDPANNRVQRFDTEGNFLGAFAPCVACYGWPQRGQVEQLRRKRATVARSAENREIRPTQLPARGWLLERGRQPAAC